MNDFRNPPGPVLAKDLKPTGPTGRGDGQSDDGDAGGESAASSHCSPRRAGVVIRATVEHIGLAGETELTVNVKWPTATFCAQPCEKVSGHAPKTEAPEQVPGNGPLAPNFFGVTPDPTPDAEP